MIFYPDKDGAQYGGWFIQGNQGIATYDQEDTEMMERIFNEGATFEDLADWSILTLTPDQLQTITN